MKYRLSGVLMVFRLLIVEIKMSKLKFLKLAILLCLLSLSAAQGAAQKPRRDVLPRVGEIKDTQDVGRYITGGCDYHYLGRRNKTGAGASIFAGSADGSLAMMNLNGNDVRLELVKTTLRYERHTGNAFARHEYRAGKARITVSFWQYSDYTAEYPAKIILRNGRAVQTIRAIGAPLCDAI
jgi:hypothetical protein